MASDPNSPTLYNIGRVAPRLAPQHTAAEAAETGAGGEIATTHIHPKALAIMASYKCTASCEHCCFESNPGITHRIGLSDILEAIDAATQYSSLSIVCFTGGECFLLGEDLNKAIEHATLKGVKTRCVTNGYWARSLKGGRKRLKGLRDSGLKEISISTGDYHLKYVDLETVINAILLSVELGLKTDVTVELTKTRTVSAKDVWGHPRLSSLTKEQKKSIHLYESPWMPMHYQEVIDQHSPLLLNRDNVYSFKGCDSLFTTVALTPYKKIGLCCGLSREMIPELNVAWQGGSVQGILDQAGADFMKIWIFIDGPERIVAWAASIDPEIEWENMYAHRCHACLALYQNPRIRKVIREHYQERVSDVLMRYCMVLRKQECLVGNVY